MAVDLDQAQAKYAAFTPAQIIEAWRSAKRGIDELAQTELELRALIVANAFPAEDGTHYFDLGDGSRLKCERRTNYTLGKRDEVEAALMKVRNVGNQGAFLADRIIRWKPELVIKEYKDLDPIYRTCLEGVITSKPALPSLEFVPPKGT